MSGTRLTEHQRDARDLLALALLEAGHPQHAVCSAFDMSRGPLVRMLREIRDDIRANGGRP